MKNPMRSVLFVPGDSERKFLSSQKSDADAVVLDLEDGVGPNGKEAARELLPRLLSVQADANRRSKVGVRINAVDTLHVIRDLECLSLCDLRPDFVIAPMVASPRDIDVISAWLSILRAADKYLRRY